MTSRRNFSGFVTPYQTVLHLDIPARGGPVSRLIPLLLSLLFLLGCGSRSSTISTSKYTYNWVCPLDGTSRTDSIIVYKPLGGGRHPAMVFHRGRGFNYDDYNGVLGRIAAGGVVCVTVTDSFSFDAPAQASAADPGNNYISPPSGMLSASFAMQEELSQLMLNCGDSVDASSVYFAGHSRGGGATEFLQSRGVAAKGFIYYMAFNLDFFYPGAVPPQLPGSTPSLVLAATQDGDLGYASTSALERAMPSPSQFLTIQGGTHDFIGDFNNFNGAGSITREAEHDIIVNATLAFIR